jgi:hypothetical protein
MFRAIVAGVLVIGTAAVAWGGAAATSAHSRSEQSARAAEPYEFPADPHDMRPMPSPYQDRYGPPPAPRVDEEPPYADGPPPPPVDDEPRARVSDNPPHIDRAERRSDGASGYYREESSSE